MQRPLTLLLVVVFTISVAAEQLAVLSGGSARGSVIELAEAFQKQTGHVLTVEFDTTPGINRRLGANEAPDVLIAATAIIDQAVKDGRAVADTRTPLGRVGMGVAVSKGEARPDVSTPDALKAALLKAERVLVTQGASGLSAAKMFGDLGVAEQIKARIVSVESGAALIERLGTSRGEVGLGYVSELRYGAAHGGGDVVGAVPRSLQSFAGYDAVVMTAARAPQAARQFVRALASDAARASLLASGWEPLDVRAQ